LLMALISAFASIVNCLFRLINRIIRHMNIRRYGWPPPHCDADGDFIKIEEEEERNDLS
jgi:hypothetical protein